MKKLLRKLQKDTNADLDMVITGIIIAITLAISIIIVLNIVGTIDTSTMDDNYKRDVLGLSQTNTGGTAAQNDALNATWNATVPVANSTGDLNTNIGTFFTIAPITMIIIAAVAILGYVMLLRRK